MQHKSRRTSKQPELCKHETQKGWKKYLNEAWMWIQINICGVVQTECLRLSLWWFLPLKCCKRLRPALWPSDGDCSLLFKSWDIMSILFDSHYGFLCVWIICWQMPGCASEYHSEERGMCGTFSELQNVNITHAYRCLELVCDCRASIFTLSVTWKIIIRSLRSTKAAYNFSSASKPSEPLTAYIIQNIQISNHTRNKWLILTEEIWGEQYMILLKSINTHCTHTF